jgi:predicted dehydrogenase
LADPASFGEFRLTYRTGDILSPHVDAAEPIHRELDDFCEAILHGTTPLSSTELGVDVVRTVEAVDLSLALGGRPVDVAPAETATAYADPAVGNGSALAAAVPAKL